jgi:hypothetical protein
MLLAGLLVGFIFVIFLFSTPLLDAPFVTTRSALLKEIKQALALKEGSVLYDLGCGDGKILKYCLEQSKGVRAVGVEQNVFPYLLAKWNLRKQNAEVLFKNIFNTDIRSATHIYLYLFPKMMERLLPKILKECKKGTRIVSCDFYFSKLEPDEIIHLDHKNHKLGKKLYVYVIK